MASARRGRNGGGRGGASGLTRPAGVMLPMRVWDAPTRLFHWSLVLLVTAAFITGFGDWPAVHVRIGEAVLTLVLFRLVWGIVGSDNVRFGRLVGSPAAALRHLAQLRRREPDTATGHNPAGAWMVLALLALLVIQVGSGLFARRPDVAAGPFARFVSPAFGESALLVHQAGRLVLLVVIGLHIAAVVAYAVLKGQNLVRPMITGKKRLPAATRAPRMAPPALAALVLVAVVLVVWFGVARL